MPTVRRRLLDTPDAWTLDSAIRLQRQYEVAPPRRHSGER